MTTESSQAMLRQCLGQFATGVTVVTCKDHQGRACGITANSFSSVSLDPPLVLWNIAKASNSLEAYLGAEHYAFHILAADQEALSQHFADTDHTRFDRVSYESSAQDVPILSGCVAVLHCSTRETIDCGDHHIIIGHVDRFDTDGGDPLLFFGGDYRKIAPTSRD